jgi:hypothetical protein
MKLQRVVELMPLLISLALGSLVWVMARRKLRTELPHFFRYVTAYAISLFVTFLTCNTPYYDYAFWVSSFVYTVLTFFVLYEVFGRLLKPYSAVIDLARMLFAWAGAFLLLVAAMAAIATSGSQQDKFNAAMDLIDRSLMLMQCGLLMLLVVFEKRLKISWRSHSASITLGLGSSAAVGLLYSYLSTAFPAYSLQLGLLYGIVFTAFVGYWAVMLYQPEPQRKNVLDSPSRLIFQRWNEVLMTTPISSAQGSQIAMAEVDSFIPGVEKTVERIMARKMSVN